MPSSLRTRSSVSPRSVPTRSRSSALTATLMPANALRDAAAALGLDLARSWMIGDRWRDVDCGQRAGVRTVFIDRGYAEALRTPPDFTVASFAAAADLVLRHA